MIEPLFKLTVPPALVVIPVNADVPPITPPRIVAPELLIVRVRAPLTVDASVMVLELPVLVKVVSAPSVICSL